MTYIEQLSHSSLCTLTALLRCMFPRVASTQDVLHQRLGQHARRGEREGTKGGAIQSDVMTTARVHHLQPGLECHKLSNILPVQSDGLAPTRCAHLGRLAFNIGNGRDVCPDCGIAAALGELEDECDISKDVGRPLHISDQV